MKAEEIIDLIDKYWKFDNNQQHASNWHDKQDLLELFRKSTTQPQPTMAAETTAADIVEKVHYGASISDVIHLIEEYRNQPIEVNHPRTEQEEADRLVVLVSSISMSSLSECKVIAQVFTSEKITALQLRGLSTEFEEKVLTILKGM